MKIVILSASPSCEATKSIINAGVKRKHEMVVLDPKYLYLLVSDSESGYDRVYDGHNESDKPVRIKAKEIDAVISRIGSNVTYGCSVLQHFRENLNIFSTQTPDGIKTASDKLMSLQKISAAKIKVPKTVIADTFVHANWIIESVGGLPAICKTLHGSQGVGVMILKDAQQTNMMLQTFGKQGTKLLFQQFIDAQAKDIRAIVIDGKVVVAMERSSNNKNDIRANISQGGSGRKIELSDADKDLCIRAARACGLEVAGVDLIKNANNESFIIEVNGNYGYKIETITGVDISTPLIQYCERNGTNKPTVKETENDKETKGTTKTISLESLEPVKELNLLEKMHKAMTEGAQDIVSQLRIFNEELNKK